MQQSMSDTDRQPWVRCSTTAADSAGTVLAPAKSLEQMERVIFNDYVNATLAGFFMFVVLAVLLYGIRTVLASRKSAGPTAKETPFVAMPSPQVP